MKPETYDEVIAQGPPSGLPFCYNSYSTIYSKPAGKVYEAFADAWHAAGEPPMTKGVPVDGVDWWQRHYEANSHIADLPRHHGDTAMPPHSGYGWYIEAACNRAPELLQDKQKLAIENAELRELVHLTLALNDVAMVWNDECYDAALDRHDALYAKLGFRLDDD